MSTMAFFDEFTVTPFLEEILTTHCTVIICEDFNIHYDKMNDLDRIAFDKMCDIKGLCQIVHCQTHRSGNTLDLIMIRNNDKIVCDNNFIHTYLALPKPKIIRGTRDVWKISAINSTKNYKRHPPIKWKCNRTWKVGRFTKVLQFWTPQCLRQTCSYKREIIYDPNDVTMVYRGIMPSRSAERRWGRQKLPTMIT